MATGSLGALRRNPCPYRMTSCFDEDREPVGLNAVGLAGLVVFRVDRLILTQQDNGNPSVLG